MSKSLQTAAAAQGFKIMIWGKKGGTKKVFILVFFCIMKIWKPSWAHWPVRHIMILDCPRPGLAKGVEVDGVGDLS